jgi:hypothetical protein
MDTDQRKARLSRARERFLVRFLVSVCVSLVLTGQAQAASLVGPGPHHGRPRPPLLPLPDPLSGWLFLSVLAPPYSALAAGFAVSDLQVLCFHLDTDYQSLPGEGRMDKARELVLYLDRHRRIDELLTTGKELRPDVPRDELASQS